MEEAKGLAYDDSQSDSNAKVMGADSLQGPALSLRDETANSPPHTPRSVAPRQELTVGFEVTVVRS